jgi:hypothetical protein
VERNWKDEKSGKGMKDSLVDVLRVEGVNAKGFGTIPKAVMKDRRLSIQAKAIYSYFCSYAGAGNRAFPGREIILKDLQISKDFYYKNLKMLKDLDYIRVKRENGKGGRFGRNIYTLVPCPVSQDMASHPSPMPPDTVGQDINSNRYKKDIGLSINPKIDKDWMERIDEYSGIIKENIEYEQLMNEEQNKSLAESIYLLIMDVLCGKEKIFKINGTNMNAQIVRKRFLELRYLDVSSVIDGIGKLAEPIRNARHYLLTALYNARATSDTYWKADINATMRAYRERSDTG